MENHMLYPLHDPYLDGYEGEPDQSDEAYSYADDDEVNEWDEDVEDMKHDYSE